MAYGCSCGLVKKRYNIQNSFLMLWTMQKYSKLQFLGVLLCEWGPSLRNSDWWKYHKIFVFDDFVCIFGEQIVKKLEHAQKHCVKFNKWFNVQFKYT